MLAIPVCPTRGQGGGPPWSEDPPTDLVRRDAYFAELGLTDADVETREQVVAVLAEHPRLLQRPVLVKGDRAIIGRPKERVAALLAD